jgi:hypothetical protein
VRESRSRDMDADPHPVKPCSAMECLAGPRVCS